MTNYVLERHAYAPEMNTLWIHKGRVRAALPAPGATTIREARRRLFPRTAPRIVATVTTHYDDPQFKGLERSYKGAVSTRKVAVDFARDLRAKNPGAVLIDGRTLPPLRVKVRTEIRDLPA